MFAFVRPAFNGIPSKGGTTNYKHSNLLPKIKLRFPMYQHSLLATMVLLLASNCFGQQAAPKSSTDKINQESVTETVKFLASDELAGRDTPSPGLDKASDFVAKRFKQAGLEPLGTDGSFFQTTTKATARAPRSAVLTNDGQPLKTLGVLSANEKAFHYRGAITLIKGKPSAEQKFNGPVSFVAPPFNQRSSKISFAAKIEQLRSQGATACLVQVSPKHELLRRAYRASQLHLADEFKGITGPVILISPTELRTVSIDLDQQVNGTTVVKNVIGVVRGNDPTLAKQAIIFSAHLDHIGIANTTGDNINNGADDDASGVTAVLTLADAYTALPTKPKRSVIFMTFWGEERGLLGSRHYASDPTWPLADTIANLNLEMLGRPEAGAHGKVWMTGWDQSDLGTLLKAGARQAGVLVFEHPRFSGFLYQQSDNWSLVEKGVIAHSFSAGSLHSDYHQPSDEWERLQLDHMTKVIRGLFAGSLPIANGELTPAESANRRPVR